MNDPEIIKIISEAFKRIAPEIKFSDIDFKMPLRSQVDIDSYDFYQLLIKIESTTSIKIPEIDLKGMKCLNDLVQYIKIHS
jgi:acyl carrier protein